MKGSILLSLREQALKDDIATYLSIQNRHQQFREQLRELSEEAASSAEEKIKRGIWRWGTMGPEQKKEEDGDGTRCHGDRVGRRCK